MMRRHVFVKGDIGDSALLVAKLLEEHRPRAVINFAAESHVDRSIMGPSDFIQTNVVGTFNLLESVRGYWTSLSAEDKAAFRFLHVSTDEVYGTLSAGDEPFLKPIPISPIALTPRQKQLLIIWCALGITPMGCLY
jgi:dTDP-glucose 4,6-dehydratase